MNSGDDEAIAVTVSVHLPLLLRTRGRSSNAPTQTLPKSPAVGEHQGQPRRRRVSEHRDQVRPGRIVAQDLDRPDLRAEARRPERIITSSEPPG